MKKQIHITLICLLLMAGSLFAANETVLFNDNSGDAVSGSYNPTATFSLDVSASWTGYNALGLSYWLQVPDALAPFIAITDETYFTWTDPNQAFFGSDQFDQTSGNDPGFMNEDRDLGGTSVFAGGEFQQTQPPGTYQVSTLVFALNGAPAGTYELRTTSLSPKMSQISDTDFTSHSLTGQAIYTITVIPEPATWSLLALGGIGSFGLTWLRARRRS